MKEKPTLDLALPVVLLLMIIISPILFWINYKIFPSDSIWSWQYYLPTIKTFFK